MYRYSDPVWNTFSNHTDGWRIDLCLIIKWFDNQDQEPNKIKIQQIASPQKRQKDFVQVWVTSKKKTKFLWQSWVILCFRKYISRVFSFKFRSVSRRKWSVITIHISSELSVDENLKYSITQKLQFPLYVLFFSFGQSVSITKYVLRVQGCRVEVEYILSLDHVLGPSHSWTSRLLTSSVYPRHVDSSILSFSLSLNLDPLLSTYRGMTTIKIEIACR